MAEDIVLIGTQEIETTNTLQARVAAVHNAYKSVMQDGVHYGIIPGTGKKPSLLKPGAEMLCTQFRLAPSYAVERTDLPGGHREYGVTCTLTKLDTGQVWAPGIGLCTTMESRYRYRNTWDNGQKRRVENPDIADVYNTVLKMAKKRALVDATLTATGCSDMFTQDVEDFAQPQAPKQRTGSSAKKQAPKPKPKPKSEALEPVRDRFRKYQWARGDIGAQQATQELCEAVGITSMEDADAKQVEAIVAIMDDAITQAEASYEVQDGQQDAKSADESNATIELYDAEVEF